MEELEVRVEQKHIDGCLPKSSGMCAIYRALREQHPREEWKWLVGLDAVYRWPGQPIPLPKKAVQFQEALLANLPVKPFTFTLKIEDD